MPVVILCIALALLGCYLFSLGIIWCVLITGLVWACSMTVLPLYRLSQLQKRVDTLEAALEQKTERPSQP